MLTHCTNLEVRKRDKRQIYVINQELGSKKNINSLI